MSIPALGRFFLTVPQVSECPPGVLVLHKEPGHAPTPCLTMTQLSMPWILRFLYTPEF